MSANLRMTEKYIRSCGARGRDRISARNEPEGRGACAGAARAPPAAPRRARLHGLGALAALHVLDAPVQRQLRGAARRGARSLRLRLGVGRQLR
jgi:hypothetical protein